MAPTSQRSQNTSWIGAHPAKRHPHIQMPSHLPSGIVSATHTGAPLYGEEGRLPARLTDSRRCSAGAPRRSDPLVDAPPRDIDDVAQPTGGL